MSCWNWPQADRGILRQLTARFDVAAAPDELVAATRQAIADATDFDERDINRNFDYDYEAYREVKRNLGRLIDSGQLRLAMQLSLELMKQGSYQVEMSDEGMMTEDIEDCLSVVLKTLKKCDLPADEVIAWCSAMLDNDRVGFIAERATSVAAKPRPGSRSTIIRRQRAPLRTEFTAAVQPPRPSGQRSQHPATPCPSRHGGSDFTHSPEGS